MIIYFLFIYLQQILFFFMYEAYKRKNILFYKIQIFLIHSVYNRKNIFQTSSCMLIYLFIYYF